MAVALPKLSTAVNWDAYEAAVLTVLKQALRRLALIATLPRAEEPINLELYWLMRRVHLELVQAKTKGMLQFLILSDAASQPEPDDAARSTRLRKRPDFNCAMMNPQAPDHQTSQVNYYVECKRLGRAEGAWVLNDNYSEHGIKRFAHADWQYAKGYTTATMVGYLQNSPSSSVLAEVNTAATRRGFPSLALAASNWTAKDVTLLSQPSLARVFPPSPFMLNHYWIDLCHCEFVTPTAAPPVSAAKQPRMANPAKPSKKAAARKRATEPRSQKKPG